MSPEIQGRESSETKTESKSFFTGESVSDGDGVGRGVDEAAVGEATDVESVLELSEPPNCARRTFGCPPTGSSTTPLAPAPPLEAAVKARALNTSPETTTP